jgi:hypothetical protein
LFHLPVPLFFSSSALLFHIPSSSGVPWGGTPNCAALQQLELIKFVIRNPDENLWVRWGWKIHVIKPPPPCFR